MAVTERDIVLAYRLLLGRAPSQVEATAWLHIPSVAELAEIFLASDECRNFMHGKIPSLARERMADDAPQLAIEVTAEGEPAARLVQRITAVWNALGATEPHWSVLSMDAFKADNLSLSVDAFYGGGRKDALLIAAILARHGLAPQMFPRMVEYGCGVGRVTAFLAEQFAQVTAIDISSSHLALAQQVIQQRNAGNVRLQLAQVPEFGMTDPFDLWFSRIVLQHNPPPVMTMVLRRMFAMLAPNGVAIFQVPTYVPGYRYATRDYLEAPATGEIEVHCLPQETVFTLAHNAGCRPLEVAEDDSMAHPWVSNMFMFRKSG